MRLGQIVFFEQADERTNMKLEADLLGHERLVTHAEAHPVERVDIEASFGQYRYHLHGHR